MNENKKIVLIVDDDIEYLFQMKINIEKMGFQVITAEGQLEAEQILEKMKPDIAIIDLMMESEDSGFILSYKLKMKYPDIPIIIATAVTAETGITFENDLSQNNSWIKADLFIDKGIRMEQLQREINKLLNIS
ncbi:MAG TPA: response regulator [Bacteroidales bacterium]|nr:response regulator [Bacteroidales bacterium]